ALPELCVDGGGRARRGAQRGLVLRHDGQREQRGGEGNHHCTPSPAPPSLRACCCAGSGPTSPEAMKRPSALGGAMMTCTLSDSLSATVFWISSGWRLSSAPSRAICSLATLPRRSRR